MFVDALAERLSRILEEGSIIGSALSRSMRATLEPLFWAGALHEQKAGGGRRVVLIDRQAVEIWVQSRYPSGLQGPGDEMPPRAAAVATFRDSKAGSRLAARPVFMRGFRGAYLERAGTTLPLAELTETFGVAGVLVDPEAPWDARGRLVLVENCELFMHVERVITEVDIAVWSAGRMDQRLLDWLALSPGVQVLHVGDYDPVGLDEYLRVAAALPERSRLFVPDDLEERLVRFGSVELLLKSSGLLQGVRGRANDEVRAVLDVIERHGRALEQEGLLVPLGEE